MDDSSSDSASDERDSSSRIELKTIQVAPSSTNHSGSNKASSDSSSSSDSDSGSDDEGPNKTTHHKEEHVKEFDEIILKLGGKDVPLSQYNATRATPTSVEVRHLNYKVKVEEVARIQTLSNIFKKKKKIDKVILDDISFVLQPGEMTLMLGGPGSGKTSLFDCVAGRRKGDITGTVTVNGKVPDRSNFHRAVSYVIQKDIHQPVMTVRETFEFAAALQMPETATEQQKAERVEAVLQMLGLKHQENTVIGNAVLRGVSGGEKRRASIGVEWLKEPVIFLLDEPTTGLDSAASLDIVKILKVIAKSGIPVLCALLQPSWEIVSMFDKLMILTKGQVAYHGAVNQALDYFEEIGFNCPKNYNPSEFLSEVVDHPDKFVEDVETSTIHKASSREGFVKYWRKHQMSKEMENLLTTKYSLKDDLVLTDSALGSSDDDLEKYPTTFGEQLKWNFWREKIKFQRDLKNIAIITINEAILGLIMGAFFWDLPDTNTGFGSKMGLLFFCLVHCMMSSVGKIPMLFPERELYYYQRTCKYYSTLPYYIATTLLSFPALATETVVFGTVVYWMTGLNSTDAGGRFGYFILLLIVAGMAGSFYGKAVASITPTPVLGSLVGSSFMSLFMLFSGFLIAKPGIPDGWIWMYWVSPLHYMIEGLAVNEMIGKELYCLPHEYVPPATDPRFNLTGAEGGFEGQQMCPFTTGEQVLDRTGFGTELDVRWQMFGASSGYLVLFMVVYFLGTKYLRFQTTSGGGYSDHAPEVKVKDEAQPEKRKDAATLVWRNLSYTITMKKKEKKLLLDDVYGYVKPGMLLALMGASGAGKSTLLDVLAQRKNAGTVEGDIFIDGKKPSHQFNRIIGYVEQTDVLFPSHTVRESVRYSAKLRLPKETTKEERNAMIDNVMSLLDLHGISDELVGDGALGGGLSLEQRKRVNIAIELTSNPKVLFLDEPTSGLDSDGADKVMAAIKKIADSGASVICTIHQPSSRIFSRATHLLLLKKGGKMLYFGALGNNFNTLLSYYDSIDLHCGQYENPASFILDTSDAGIGRAKKEGGVQLNEAFRASELHKQMRSEVDDIVERSQASSSDHESRLPPYALPFNEQLKENCSRFFVGIWRTPKEIVAAFIRAVLLGVIFGTVFSIDTTQEYTTARVALMFVAGIYANMTSFANMPGTFARRPLFYRESFSAYYHSSAYTLAQILSDLPLQIFGASVFSTILYWSSGLRADAGRFFFFLLSINGLSLCSFQSAQMLISLLPSFEAVVVVYGSFFAIFALGAGFMIPKDSLPNWLIWTYWISFLHYSIESASVNELEGLEFSCPNNRGAVPIETSAGTNYYCPVTNGDQVINQYNMDPDMKWPDIAILYGLYVVFVAITIVAQKFIRHQKR